MLYEDYERRLAKRNERIASLWKLRYLFAVLLFALALCSVLLAIAGTVTEINCAQSVVYGESPSVFGKAVFKDVSYRYRTIEGEWTAVAPKDAGTYEVQAVSHGLAGKERVSEVRRFSILPAPLTVKVTDADVDFGKLPQNVWADALKYVDKLVAGEFVWSYDGNTMDVLPVKEQLRVTDGDGTELRYKPTDWTVESVPVGVQKEWVTAELCGSLTEVGILSLAQVAMQSSFFVTDDAGKNLLSDETDPNRVDLVGVPLTVLARPVTVTSVSVSQTKGDSPLYGNSENCAWISSGTLLDGHEISFDITGVLTLDMQSAPNTVFAKVFDENKQDVSRFYDFSYNYGTLSWI